RRAVADRHVVGQAGDAVARAQRADRGDHLGPDLARQPGQDEAGVDGVAVGAGLGLEPGAERGLVEFAALHARPRVAVGVGRVEALEEAGREAGRALVGQEAVDRARQDDAAEVEQDGVDGGQAPRSSWSLNRATWWSASPNVMLMTV